MSIYAVYLIYVLFHTIIITSWHEYRLKPMVFWAGMSVKGILSAPNSAVTVLGTRQTQRILCVTTIHWCLLTLLHRTVLHIFSLWSVADLLHRKESNHIESHYQSYPYPILVPKFVHSMVYNTAFSWTGETSDQT